MSEKAIRVAVIDDDEDFLALARAWLSDFEGARFEAAFFQRPMDIYDPHHLKPFDVYVVDYRLGLIDGIDLINGLRGKIHPGPFILCSGVLTPTQRERAAASEIEMVIEKDLLASKEALGKMILAAAKLTPKALKPR